MTDAAPLIPAENTAPICPRCGGSGEVTGMAGAGPDAYTIDVECSTCAGTGSAVDSGSQNPAARRDAADA